MAPTRRNFKLIGIALALIPALGSLVAVNSSEAANVQPSYELITHVPVSVLPANAVVNVYSSTNLETPISSSRLETTDAYGWWGVSRIPAGTGSLCFSATGITRSSVCVNPAFTKQVWLDANGVPYLTRVAAAKNIKVHLSTSNKTYRYGVLTVNGISQSQPFVRVGTTDFVATFTVPENTTAYTIKTQSTRSKKLYDDIIPIEGDASKLSEIYLTSGLRTIFSSVAEQTNTVYIHYHRDDNVYKSWGLHTWYDGSVGGPTVDTTWARPKTPVSSKPDAWGITFKVPLAAFTSKLPYIIHKGDLKDPSNNNQYVDLAKHGYEIWVESGKADVDGSYLIAYPQLPGLDMSVEELSLADATALVGEPARSAFASDSIYFVMTDRYKNGDTSNDYAGLGSTNKQVTGYDNQDMGYYHGGDLAGLSDGCQKTDGSGEGLPRIKNLGFTAIWITPPFKQNYVQGGSAAYHGYWITDFTTIDPHWGTNAQFKTFVDCAHRLGMKVVLDIVMNHTGDIISYRDNSYGYHTSPNTTAYIPSWATNLKAPSWLNDLSNYHNQGNIGDWNNNTQLQNGDFIGLDDIKTESDVVINGFADVYSTWVNDFGVDGFRVDTARHVDNQFFSKWWAKMKEKSTNPNIFAFGEYWDDNPVNQSNYMRKYGLPSALDFTFQSKVLGFASGGTAPGLSGVYDSDNLYVANGKSPNNLITFLGNHDKGRVGWLLGQSGDTRVKSDLLAHDILFLTRGIPAVYYGDEVGMIGNGGDKAARQDMFSSAVSTWRNEDRVFGSPIGTGSSLTVSTPLTSRITLLNSIRKSNPALASGAQTTRLSDANTLVISRFDASNRTEYVVGFNSGTTAKTVKITTATPLTSWQSLLASGTVSSSATGELSISIPARSTVVYKSLSPIPVANEAVFVALGATLDTASSSVQLSAAVANSDFGTVTFAVKKGDGVWQAVGTDDSRSFGMTWDYRPYVGEAVPNGTKVSFAAIYKSSSGVVSVSTIKTLTITN